MSYVLVVDDDLDSGEALTRMLRKRGHQAIAASNGHEGLSLLMGARPDVIVLDLRMPKMDGAMFLEVLRSYLRFQQVPVLLLTAFPDSPQVARAQAFGVLAVFEKGRQFTPLFTTIERIIPPADVRGHPEAGVGG